MNTAKDLLELSKKHTFYDWLPQGNIGDPLLVTGGEGVEIFTADGKRYLDLCSQLWCVNAGHRNKKIIAAITEQLNTLAYASPFLAHESRALLGQELAKILPGDINKVFFTLGGAESNEHAIKIARMVTGKHKILARYRSYHGATTGAASLTGDPRRWVVEPGLPGVVRIPDFHRWGKPLPENTAEVLEQTEEVIQYEGAHTIAAMIIEPVVGANGVLIPPDGYMQGIRDICTRNHILLITDEIMSGFGRTGKWFAVDHWKVVPDIITLSKGLTSAYVPLGAVGVRDTIAEYFQEKPFMTGLTYNSHPVGCRAALAAISCYQEEKLIENSHTLGIELSKQLHTLQEKHPCVGATRSIGLFGAIELVRRKSPYTPLTPYNGTTPEIAKLKDELLKRGVYTMLRWNILPVSPPLCITKEQLTRALNAVDQALTVVDQLIADC